MSEKIIFTPQQQAAIETQGGALLVSAAAGSGKTRILVERLLRRLTDEENPRDIGEFLVITYTNAAAAELRSKIIDGIAQRLSADPRNRRLRRQLVLCYSANIGTIHSFCSKIIRENAHSLGVLPDFRVADEEESRTIKLKALNDLLDEKYESISENPGFGELVDTMSAGRDDSKLMQIVLDTHAKLQSHPYPKKWIDGQLEMLRLEKITDMSETVWGRYLMDSAKRTAEYWRGRIAALIREAEVHADFYKSYGVTLRNTYESLDLFVKALDVSWDEARRYAEIDFSGGGRISGYDDFKEVRNRCKAEMATLKKWFAADSAGALEDMRAVTPVIEELLTLTSEFDGRYAAEKRVKGLIDFSDQEHMAVRLLTDEETMSPTETAKSVSRRFEEIMVDEYQDVNAVQELIFNAISREGKNIFMVGDVKQSIYRFRLADPTIFLDKYRRFKDAEDAQEGEGRRVILSKNFRSREQVLDGVNFIFKNIMSTEFGEMDYTQREYLYAGASYPQAAEPAVELNVLDLSGVEEDEDSESPGKTELEAEFTAARIEELLASAAVSDGGGGFRPARYGDIALLLRSTKNKAARYAAALAARGIPTTLDKSEGFFDTLEISTIVALLTIIDNPLSDIPLITVLRSPVFGFTSDELTEIRLRDTSSDFYTALLTSAEESKKCRDFTDRLESYREAAPDMAVDELIWHIYGDTGMMGVMGAMKGGHGRIRNLKAFLEYAVKYEKAGYRGLFSFILFVRQMIERKEDPPLGPAEDADAVRIMSIHKSKGLEFPIVILADTAKRFNMMDTTQPLPVHPGLGAGPKRHHRERRIEYPTAARHAVARQIASETLSEELRVLYVAMTRAKEKLIITASYANARKTMEKLLKNRELPIPPQALEGMRSMADWILSAAVLRPESKALRFGQEIAVSADFGPRWDIRLVPAEIYAEYAEQSQAGERDEPAEDAALEETGPDPEIVAEIRRKLKFTYPHSGAVNIPSKLTATEAKGRFADTESSEEAESIVMPSFDTVLRRPDFAPKRETMTGAERGNALHLTMQYMEARDYASHDEVRGEILRLEGLGILTREQADSVPAGKILDFFRSETGRIMLTADKLYREFKFSLLIPAGEIYPGGGEDKILLQGMVDCAAARDGKITIIDFKTDRVEGEALKDRAEYYRGQVEIYKKAMERVTGLPAGRGIIYFFHTGEGVEI